MISPVGSYPQNEYQTQTKPATNVENDSHFSLGSSAADEGNGVVYESSAQKEAASNKGTASNKEASSKDKKDSFQSSLDLAASTREKREAGPDATTYTLNAIWNELKNLFGNIWKGIRQVVGNLWTSKPLNEGLKTKDTNTVNDADNDVEAITATESGKAINNNAISSIDDFEKNRDDNIRKALADGDKDKFRDLISENGQRPPARSTSKLTTYDAKGRIVNLNPSDENKILHGDRGVQKL